MTHEELRLAVKWKTTVLGLFSHYCRNSRYCHGQPGFPDLAIVGPRGVIFRELKSEYDDTTADQDHWGWLLQQPSGGMIDYEPLGIDRWRIWRPADLESGLISSELEALGGTPQ